MKNRILLILTLLIFLWGISCKIPRDIKSYQQLSDINYDNVFKYKKNQFWIVLNNVGHKLNLDYNSNKLNQSSEIDSALYSRLNNFCDTFKGIGFGPHCWHINNCYNMVAVGMTDSSRQLIDYDSLRFYTNADSLIQLIAPINNIDKVHFLLLTHEYYFDYKVKRLSAIKETTNGFYCIGIKKISDCPVKSRKILLYISADGKIIELKKGRKFRSSICI